MANGYFWALAGIMSWLVILALYKLVGWSRAMTAAAARQRGTDRLLFVVVLSAGLVAGAIGFVYSQLNNEGIASFLASAFANLGSGFIGAAITFVLFQSLLAKRSARDEGIEALRQEFASLRIKIASLTELDGHLKDGSMTTPGGSREPGTEAPDADNVNLQTPLPSTAAVILLVAGFLAGIVTASRRSRTREP